MTHYQTTFGESTDHTDRGDKFHNTDQTHLALLPGQARANDAFVLLSKQNVLIYICPSSSDSDVGTYLYECRDLRSHLPKASASLSSANNFTESTYLHTIMRFHPVHTIMRFHPVVTVVVPASFVVKLSRTMWRP